MFKDRKNRLVLWLLLLVLAGTIGASSLTVPYTKISYLAFLLLCAVFVAGLVARGTVVTLKSVTWRPYDLVPLALLGVWAYGFILGLARHNRVENVIANFAGMTMYSVYYVLLFRRVNPFDLLRSVLAAAAVTTAGMFAFFFWDKELAWRLFDVRVYFKWWSVRSYYSETLMLLSAPIALSMYRLLSPSVGARHRHDAATGARLAVFSFAFLQISLSKATLLSFGLLLPLVTLGSGLKVIDLFRTRRVLALSATGAALLFIAYPATHVLSDYIPQPDWGPESELLPPKAAAVAADVRAVETALDEFVDSVSAHLGPSDRVLIWYGNASTFNGRLPGRLAYPGGPDARTVTAAEWHVLDDGSPTAVDAALARLHIGHLIAQTWQPRQHVQDVCAVGSPLVRSRPIRIDSRQSYAFELYAIGPCAPPPPPPPAPPPAPSARVLRQGQATALLQDLHWFGKGLGSSLASGYQRDSRGYGFEQNYLNLIHKFGVFAGLIFLAYFVVVFRIVRGLRNRRTRHFALASLAVCTGLVMGYGNPILMSPVMVTLHAIALYWLRPAAPRAGAVRRSLSVE
jgi:hypothetical protein